MFVTAELLDKLNACKAERDHFAELFPSGVELTRELIVQHAQEFDWTWCAKNLASAAGYAAYRQADEQAQAAYQQAIGPAYAAYLQAEAEAEAEAWDAYRQVEGPADAAYNLACAAAFAEVMGL